MIVLDTSSINAYDTTYLKSKNTNNIFKYLSEKVIYFNSDYSSLNGIIIRTHKNNVIYPNPFTNKDILIDEDLLMKLFNFDIK